MKRIQLLTVLFALATLVACGNDPKDPTKQEAPHWKADNGTLTEAPLWQVTDHDDYPSSMVMTVAAPDAAVPADAMATLHTVTNDVLGVGNLLKTKNAYQMYVHSPRDDDFYPAFRLCFYNSVEKQLYVSYAPDSLYFQNDRVLGSINAPLELKWVACGRHHFVQLVDITLDGHTWGESDEIALFVNGECRATHPDKLEQNGNEVDIQMLLPMDTDESQLTVCFYNHQQQHIDTMSIGINLLMPTFVYHVVR